MPRPMQRTAPLRRLCALVLATTLVGAGTASAQLLQILYEEGDTIPGAPGTVANIKDVSVADDGQWITYALMSTSSGSVDAAVLNGAAVLIRGDALFDPPGLSVQGFDEIAIGRDNTIWWNIDTDAGAQFDEIMYRNLIMTAREASPVSDPDAPPGTEWVDFDGFSISSTGDLIILGDIDSPLVGGNSEGAAVIQTFDAQGQLLTEEIVLMEGDRVPGTNDDLVDVGTNNAGHDVATEGGSWIVYARNDGGSSRDEMIVVDNQLIAREGNTGPILGTIWGRLASNAVDITSNGDFVFRGELEEIAVGTDNVLFKNGEPFISEGDISEFTDPYGFAEFGRNTPILLGENGNLAFFGSIDNPNTSTDECYFINDRILVQENVTELGTQVIGNLVTGPSALDMSPSGRYVIFEAFYGAGTNVVILVDLGLITEMEDCGSNEGTLKHVDGLPLLGEELVFEMDGEQDFGVTPILMISNAPILGWPPCGLNTFFGELLIDVSSGAGNPGVILSGPTSEFLPVPFTVEVPLDMNLLGTNYYAQGLWWDVGDQTSAENFRLTNGLEIILAPR